MERKSAFTNSIKRRLLAGEVVHCAWHQLGAPEAAEVMVYSGWDVIIVDGEHGPTDYQRTIDSVRAIQAAGGESICRIPTNDAMVLNKYLDAGVRSLMIPNVKTLEQAKAIAERLRVSVETAVITPPSGTLSVTVSIGVAEGASPRGHWTDVLATSDAALYEAKAQGRNRVVAREGSEAS